jgi:hypothetical protein
LAALVAGFLAAVLLDVLGGVLVEVFGLLSSGDALEAGVVEMDSL